MDNVENLVRRQWPLDILIEIARKLYFDPYRISRVALINLAIAIPEADLARSDAYTQVSYRHNPAVRDPVPLLNSAIEVEYAPMDLIRHCADALESLREGAINGLYVERRRVEPALHVAVRIGRVAAVNELLTYPTLNPDVRFGSVSKTPATCSLAGFAHAPPCDPAGPHECLTATEYAIDQFYHHGNRPIDLRNRIEDCALALLAFGHFPAPITANGGLSPTFGTAVRAGMDRYTTGVLDRILMTPDNPHRERLVTSGMRELLMVATTDRDNSNFVRYIMDVAFATAGEIFPLPRDVPEVHAFNPIQWALLRRHTQNAIAMIRMLSGPLMQRLAQTHQQWEDVAVEIMHRAYLTSRTVLRHINFDFLVAYMRYMHEQLLTSPSISQQVRDLTIGYRGSVILDLIRAGRHGLPSFSWIVNYGFNTHEWLILAMQHRNTGAVAIMVSDWTRRGVFILDQALPVGLAPNGGQMAPDRPMTALSYAVSIRLLPAVSILLNAGASPAAVDYGSWVALANFVIHEFRVRGPFGFMHTHFEYGFFRGLFNEHVDLGVVNPEAYVNESVQGIFQMAGYYGNLTMLAAAPALPPPPKW